MTKTSTATAVEAISSFQRDDMSLAARRARQIASTRTTRGSSISAVKPKRSAKTELLGPTPERMAKGDIPDRTPGGFHRAIPLIERMRDRHQLAENPNDDYTNQKYLEAAEKLRRHFEGCMIGVKAQNLDEAVSHGPGDLTGEEGWVHHYKEFKTACRLMGWSDVNPLRGAGRLVVAVVCYEVPVMEAALTHTGSGRAERVLERGMDRLREGLFALATHWRFL